MTSNYARGTHFERTTAVALRNDGYYVIRAAGSHGVADLVALKPGQVLLVQCKATGTISIADWNELLTSAMYAGAEPILAFRPGRTGLRYWRLTGERVARKPLPYEVWTPDEATVDNPVDAATNACVVDETGGGGSWAE